MQEDGRFGLNGYFYVKGVVCRGQSEDESLSMRTFRCLCLSVRFFQQFFATIVQMGIEETMRREWNARAKQNAYHWVVSGREAWDADAYYEEGRKDIRRLVLPFLAEHNLSSEHIRRLMVLDIGCGTGRLCRALGEVCAKVTGVDIAPEMVERARRENAHIAGLQFLLVSGEDIAPIQSDSIDFCFSYLVFQHIPLKRAIRRYFEEILRVLKSGGIAKIQVRGTPGNPPGKVLWFRGFGSFYVAITLWRGWVPLLWVRSYDSVYGACYSATELQKLLEKLGFRSVRVFHETERYLWAEIKK